MVRLTSVEKNELNDKQQAALDSLTQDAVIVEVSLIITHADNSTTELHELGGKVEITVSYDGPVPEGKYIVVSYISDDGGVSYVRATYNKETRQVSFSTNHFSDYALFLSGKNAYEVTVTGGSGSGTYLEGSTVAITANSKGGYSFNEWEIVSGDVTLANAAAAQTTFTMSGSDVELKATYTRNSSGGSSGGGSSKPTPEQIFADVPTTTYYYEAVKWAADKSITGGIGNNQFAPNQPCTRAQIVAFLWRTAGSPEHKAMSSFDDVSADAYYAKAVAWAVENGITSGTGNGEFSPNATCTRAQVVTFLYRAAGSPAVSGSAAFLDVDANAYYAVAVAWAAQNDITGGIGDNLFDTVNDCTRAQIVTFLYRAYQSK